jgi:hypothetical protein
MFAVAVWELLTARVAFKGLHYGAIIEHVALMGERPPVPEGAPEDFCLLMSSCWHADAQQRPAFDQVRMMFDWLGTMFDQVGTALNQVKVVFDWLGFRAHTADVTVLQRLAWNEVSTLSCHPVILATG